LLQQNKQDNKSFGTQEILQRMATVSDSAEVGENHGVIQDESSGQEAKVEVMEFFAGIGGMRVALQAALRDDTPEKPSRLHVTSIDSSHVVREVYQHNYPDETVRATNVEGMRLQDLDGKAQVWTMSPPCQPFTTTQMAQQLDLDDKRNRAFLRLMNLLEEMKDRPKCIFFENVRGFFGSQTHLKWTETLARCGYVFQQFLLTPMQFRIPNNRMRFFMIISQASIMPEDVLAGFSQDPQRIERLLPECECQDMKQVVINGNLLNCSQLQLREDQSIHLLHEEQEGGRSGPAGVNDVGAFIEKNLSPENAESLLIRDNILQKKWARGLGYTGVKDRTTFCFTSAYGNTYHRASGSIFHMDCEHRGELDEPEDVCAAYSGKVRRFSPREMLNFFGFPDSYSFPETMPNSQRFKVVGQSVNVVVVRALMHSYLCRVPL